MEANEEWIKEMQNTWFEWEERELEICLWLIHLQVEFTYFKFNYKYSKNFVLIIIYNLCLFPINNISICYTN
jgi:hypothetical protein